MSRVCHECSQNVENPFYDVSLTYRHASETVISDMSCSICESEYRRIGSSLKKECPDGYALRIDGVTGTYGGFGGTIQLTGAYERHGQPVYLPMKQAKSLLKKCVESLTERVKDHPTEWVVYIPETGGYKMASEKSRPPKEEIPC